MARSLDLIKLKQFRLVAFFFVLSVFMRFILFQNYYVYSNDDIYYFDWVSVLKSSEGFQYLDTPVFPPGYSAILLLENWLTPSLYTVKFFEQVILFSFLPILCLIFLHYLQIPYDKVFLFLVFTVPLAFVGFSTINISSEIWYTLLVSIGLLILIKNISYTRIHQLLFASGLFSFSYLIRPEGLIYFFPLFMVFFAGSSHNLISKKYILRTALLCVPPISVTAGLSYYLSQYYNSFTITGKFKMNYEISKGISENIVVRIVENLLGLIRVFLAPMFFGPLLVILSIIGFIHILNRRDKLNLQLTTVLLPTLLIVLTLVFFYPMGRPLIPALPSMIILGAIGWNFLKSVIPRSRHSALTIIIFAILFLQSLFPMATNQLYDSSKGYYEALDSLPDRPNQLVFSREPTLSLYNSSFSYCDSISDCQSAPDFLILSSSTRAKLTERIPVESDGEFFDQLSLFGVKYEKIFTTKGPYIQVYTYGKLVSHKL